MSIDKVIDVLDSYGEPTGQTLPRRVVHTQSLWHGGVHVWVYNRNGEILLQLRAPNKEIYPNTWDISAAGHASAGETPIQAAMREAHEELGLYLQPNELTFIGVTRTIRPIPNTGWTHRVFDRNYLVQKDIPAASFQLQKEELTAVRWVSIAELSADLQDPIKMTQYSPRSFYLYDLAMTEIRAALRGEK
jgi:isopentenyldiphosphate isomerase